MAVQALKPAPHVVLERLDAILADLLALRQTVQALVQEDTAPDLSEAAGVWQTIRDRVIADQPDISSMTLDQRRQEFERLSAKIAAQMPYSSLEEFEQAMRGDNYGQNLAATGTVFRARRR